MITLAPDTEQLARRLAAETGTTPEEVLRAAVEREASLAGLVLVAELKPRRMNIERARDTARQIASRPVLDPRAPREILDEVDPNARLNLGDCTAYALAKRMNAPLLFKGADFAATDIRAAV